MLYHMDLENYFILNYLGEGYKQYYFLWNVCDNISKKKLYFLINFNYIIAFIRFNFDVLSFSPSILISTSKCLSKFMCTDRHRILFVISLSLTKSYVSSYCIQRTSTRKFLLFVRYYSIKTTDRFQLRITCLNFTHEPGKNQL